MDRGVFSARDEVKIVYMGTPDFAVPALSALVREGWNVVLAVTQPDRPAGRGKRIRPTPVKSRASSLGIPVAQPEQLKGNREFFDYLIDLRPDLIVVAAYGKILPREILEAPGLGCVNIHASLLPKYRGAAPIHRAVEAGERTTGVTLMHMTEALDAGDVIATAEACIEGMNTGRAHEILSSLGAKLLVETLPAIVAGTAGRVAQDHDNATYAPLVTKTEGRVDFNETARAIANKVRAMNPAPGAYAFLGDAQIKILEAHVGISRPEDLRGKTPGAVASVSDAGIAVVAKDGIIVFDAIQAPGKKPMKVSEYLKGNVVDATKIFR